MTKSETNQKIIGSVMIGPLKYSVVEDGDGENVYEDGEDGSRVGLCEYMKCKITIHRDMSLARKRSTLAHELCHANLQWFHAIRGEWDEEDVCSVMEAYAEPIMREVDRLYPKQNARKGECA